jgi:hypothetical protein
MGLQGKWAGSPAIISSYSGRPFIYCLLGLTIRLAAKSVLKCAALYFASLAPALPLQNAAVIAWEIQVIGSPP